jgi:uncharacterized glyoxalase superfamily protein PhnB
MTNDPTRHETRMSVHLSSRDVPAAVAFYSDVLGFRCTALYPERGTPVWAHMELDGQDLMVASPMSESTEDDAWSEFHADNTRAFERGACGGVLVYLRVPDIDLYYEQIVARGARPAGEPVSQFYGIRDLPLYDRDGHRLVFYSTIAMGH